MVRSKNEVSDIDGIIVNHRIDHNIGARLFRIVYIRSMNCNGGVTACIERRT